MKAHKDKAWQEKGCRARSTFYSVEPGLSLFLALATLNLKNIQGIYSYTRSPNSKSINAL